MLTAWVSWRWGLFINVPIGIALIVARAARTCRRRERRTGRFDLAGAVDLDARHDRARLRLRARRRPTAGATASPSPSFAAGAVLLAAFVVDRAPRRAADHAAAPVREPRALRRLRRPDPGRRRHVRRCSSSSPSTCRACAASARSQAGLAFLPMTLVDVRAWSGSCRGSRARFGERAAARPAASPLALVGMAWLSRIGDRTRRTSRLIAMPMVLLGIGMGAAFTPLTTAGHRRRRARGRRRRLRPRQRRPPARRLARARRPGDGLRRRGPCRRPPPAGRRLAAGGGEVRAGARRRDRARRVGDLPGAGADGRRHGDARAGRPARPGRGGGRGEVRG